MTKHFAIGREAASARLFVESPALDANGLPSPTFHTLLAGVPEPVFVTLPAPIVSPQPDTSNGTLDIVTDGIYFDDQWHFDFLGDIEKIWEEYSGTGVHVGVYDDSLQSSHPDLVGNYDAGGEVVVNGQTVHALTPAQLGYAHGTAVAGLIAASRNEFGTTGVAWGAFLTGVPVLWNGGPVDINNNLPGFLDAVDQSENFDIINNSWGRYAGFWQAANVPVDVDLLAEWMEALENGRVKQLDGGEEIKLGTVIVKAAGNDNLNTNGDGPATTRATIVVGAYDDDGEAAYYSNFGANLLVSAPSSGSGNDSRLVTTDVTGFAGYNLINQDQTFDLDYTDDFGGTSGAAPIVSGVVALMLEANPYLGWRDVQNILAYSAREVGSGVGGDRTATESFDWRYNGAGNWNGGGLHYSEDYGYGSVDAYNAVRMAEVWGLFAAPQASANETSFSSTATDVVLEDMKNNDILFTFDGSSFEVESVSIELTITHGGQSFFLELFFNGFAFEALAYPAFLTDLQISLISPSGTVTDLADFAGRDAAVDNVGGEDGLDLSFNANAFRGEEGIGTWTLRIADPQAEDAGVVNSATVTLHGRDGDAAGQNLDDDVYHYTGEVFATLARDGSRKTLADTNGGTDWLNMAAMGSNLVVNLAQGATSTAGGLAFVTIAAGTDIENAVTGDGNDVITGNDLANRLHGMRGNDVIDGGAGDDILSGGAGNDTLTGGVGLDFFLFDRALNSLTNVDIITDFSHLDDAVWLDATIFAGLSLGTLGEDAFAIGAAAQDELDRIIYDSLTGALYYDADGSGALAALQFATLTGAPVDVSFDDFVVINHSIAPLTPTDDRVAADAPTAVTTDIEDVIGDGSPYFGTDGIDRVRGKSANDRFFLFAGDDTAYAGDGDDFIDGGLGMDFLMGAGGNDVIYGGGSPDYIGDFIYGGDGDDIIFGSNQSNDMQYLSLQGHNDLLSGQAGNDTIYGYDGDDLLFGGAGDDVLYTGDGSDYAAGGDGNDRMVMGNGVISTADGGAGIDTAVFEGNFRDYRFYSNPWEDWLIFMERLDEESGEYKYVNAFLWEDTEILEFKDVTLDGTNRSFVVNVYDPADGESITFENWEMVLNIFRAGKFDVYDEGTDDRLHTIRIVNWNFGLWRPSDITIHSDVVAMIEVGGFQGDITIDAAPGERQLLFYSFVWNDLRPEDLISDNTATSIRYNSQGQFEYLTDDYAVAAVNGYNLSFASAREFTVWEGERDTSIAWYAPNMTTIDLRPTYNHLGAMIGGGQNGRITFVTPLDDSELMTAGGSAEFRYFGSTISLGAYPGSDAAESDFIRFGNLGAVNTSNDGTVGEEAGTNAGLGLRGLIDLSVGSDEARILGTDAFQGGKLDGGTGIDRVNNYSPESDTIRMTFGVAAAIGDISEHISNFEVLRLDAPTLTGQVVDITKFDTLDRIVVAGTTVSGGDNTIANIVEDSTVTFASGTRQEQWAYTFEIFGNQFGTIHLDMAGDGANDTLNLEFKGYAIDGYEDGARPIGLDEGTIHVVDAETVNITTESFDVDVFVLDFFKQPVDMLSYEATDPFTQVLDLDVTTTVTLAGETGWDFTVAGTDIGKVTLLDASGVSGFGAIGAVKAAAQAAAGVTFIGGFGDDELTGGEGNDTLSGGAYGSDILDGGAGTDRAVFDGNWADYAISIAQDGVVTLARSDGTVDTVKNVELFKFADGTVSYANLLTGTLNDPPSVTLQNVLASLPENTSTASRIKVADIVVTDDGIGTNRLSLTGRDAALFEIIGLALFLKAGVLLDAAQAAAFEVAVAVDDDEIEGSPDGVSETLTLVIEDVPGYGTIRGTPGNDRLSGSNGNDYFDGQGGNDVFYGFRGDDTYVVDSSSDKVVELRNQGNDTVRSSASSYKLANDVENLVLTGDGDIDGTGNSGDNVIIGNAGNNRLLGGGGRDLIDGGAGDDYMDGGGGIDTVTYASAAGGVTVSLATTKAQDTGAAGIDTLRGFENLTGSGHADALTGSNSANVLDGGAGADAMAGGKGNDTYIVDNIGDTVTEVGKGGTDTVLSWVSFALSAEVENLTLTGDEAIDGTGNALANKIAGNAAANILTGGAGKDVFVFNTALGEDNVDTITDFSVADDTIHIDNAFFAGLRNGGLGKTAFAVGTDASDRYDRILYDDATGALYFDADGNGTSDKIQFAQIDAGLSLTYKDFYVI